MRNMGVTPDEEELPPGFDPADSVPLTRRSPEEHTEDLDDVLTWMRSGKGDIDDPTGDFKRIDQILPRKKDPALSRTCE
jgi:hypothetical protein